VHTNGLVIESQVDWLTVTSPNTEPHSPFHHWASSALASEAAAGNARVPWGMRGYEGWHCGRVSHGVRRDGSIVMLSGQAATDQLDTALDVAANVSRVDLAVTVRLTPPDDSLEFDHFLELREWSAAHNPLLKGVLLSSLDGSSTLYVGSRKSDRMLRVYNKELESRDSQTHEPDPRYVACHRYELEVKGDQARPTALTVSVSPLPAYTVSRMVAQYCALHGLDHSAFSDAPMGLIPGFRRRSDAETKLSWLAHSCRPTVEWLSQNGEATRAARALGYDPDTADRVCGAAYELDGGDE
jgi:hypothetical protein